MKCRTAVLRLHALLLAVLAMSSSSLAREREPNWVYAGRRARLRAQVDGPVVLFGYTGREQSTPSYLFQQEESFYYLTGHNEPGAALLLIPDVPNGKAKNGPPDILFLPPHDRAHERWEGPLLGPSDPGVLENTGFAVVLPFSDLRGEIEKLAKHFPAFYTLLPLAEGVGYPHARNWIAWLKQVLPEGDFRGIGPRLAAMRQVKSPGEVALLERAIELSIDAQLDAMKMMRPGLFEYEVAARMEYIHKRGGCEGDGYAPIVGTGFNSTVLHYSKLDARIRDGDIVVLDAAGEYAGYSADITRTLPANGKFTPRQREIYEIVLGAQNAALAALKPGMTFARNAPSSLYRITYDYIDSHGKDREGKSLGRYFIHGLGHHIGLEVHDVGDANRPLEPGMVVTIEPGIYIPEENLGVRIEDDVLITETGYKLLTARLPRSPGEIEKLMAEAQDARVAPISVWHAIPPIYPPLARQAQIQGEVIVNVEVADNGEVVNAKATTGHPLLAQAAEESVLRWLFHPLTTRTQPPPPETVVFEFRLEGEAAYHSRPEVYFDFPARVSIVTQPATVNPSRSSN